MPVERAEVVVIGGGVIGASVAWHLASRGCAGVRVLERGGAPGMGSTGKATGGYRAQFGSEVNVRLSLLAREKLRRFRDELGVDSGYRPCGYLFLADGPGTLRTLLELQATQKAAGLHEARAVAPAEVAEIAPAVDAERVAGGVFCPTDGFIRPLEILRGYTEGARRLGVRFDHGAGVAGLRREGGRIAAVRLADGGEIACGAVVNAAGAWAGAVAALAGVDLPVRPRRQQMAVTHPTDALPEDMPLTVFVDEPFNMRVRDGRVLLLRPDDEGPADPFDCTVEDGWVDGMVRRAERRLPPLARAPVDRAACLAGLYEESPDRHAILGAAPEVENFYLANGSSGHGVMHSPALGQLLAEIVVDGAARSLDVHALRPSRFAEGRPNPAVEIL